MCITLGILYYGMAILDFWNPHEAWEGCQDEKGEDNVWIWRSEDNLSKLVFSFHHVASGNGTQVVGLWDKGTSSFNCRATSLALNPNLFIENLFCSDLLTIPETGQ